MNWISCHQIYNWVLAMYIWFNKVQSLNSLLPLELWFAANVSKTSDVETKRNTAGCSDDFESVLLIADIAYKSLL